MAVSQTGQAVVLAVLVLATSVWTGGYVAIAVVARVATRTLETSARVTFFRQLGRVYLWVGAPALVVALTAGGVLLRDHEPDALLLAAVTTAVVLVLVFAVAVVQARRMTRLRGRALTDPGNELLAAQVAGGARAAGALRAGLGLLTLALVVLGSFLAT